MLRSLCVLCLLMLLLGSSNSSQKDLSPTITWCTLQCLDANKDCDCLQHITTSQPLLQVVALSDNVADKVRQLNETKRIIQVDLESMLNVIEIKVTELEDKVKNRKFTKLHLYNSTGLFIARRQPF